MALQSQLFHGDPKLEAAAVSDPAHIIPGAKGEHVRKIQLALIQLDGATTDADDFYGSATAAAVLDYKRKRNIVNRAYQTQADNIVGRMTMASLDSEMLKQESRPDPVHIQPMSYWAGRPPRSPALVALLNNHRPLELNFAIGSGDVAAPRIIPGPPTSSNTVMEMHRNSAGMFLVVKGSPGEVVVADPAIAKIREYPSSRTPSNRAPVLKDWNLFEVFSGQNVGRTTLTATAAHSKATIDVVVKTFFKSPTFMPGVNHAHAPVGRWTDVQKNPNNSPGDIGATLADWCTSNDSPSEYVNYVMKSDSIWSTKPIAVRHINWYLRGTGTDFVEDDYIKIWLTKDRGIKRRLKGEIFPRHRRPKGKGHFLFESHEYDPNSDEPQDFRFAFGAIDRVDFEVDFSQDTVRVWFQDRYEWHPFYSFYPSVGPTHDFPKSGDTKRPTNSLHAAMVEMKRKGAADFWMKGMAEIALSMIAHS